MKLPADFKDVIDEAVNIDAARQTALSVSVLIDGTAPADVVAHVRALFASEALHARITVGYLDSQHQAFSEADDVAVLVAGIDARIGAKASEIRAAGVPVMVVTTLFDQVKLLAEESGYPIPQGDLLCPDLSDEAKSQAQEAFEAFFGKIAAPDALDFVVEHDACGFGQAMGAHGAEGGAGARGAHAAAETAGTQGAHSLELLRGRAASARATLATKAKTVDLARFFKKGGAAAEQRPAMPSLLGEEQKRVLDNRMGEWIIATCRSKRLSFALAFPFVARPLSLEAINATAVQNAGIGVVVFLPGADMPVMTANQMKMILQIAAAYGQPMTIDRAKELLVVLGGAFAARSAARSVAGVVPGFGWAVKGAIGYAATLAMGHAALEYFENGAGLMGATGAVVSAKDAAVKAVGSALGAPVAPSPQTAQEKNQQTAQTVKAAAGNAAAVAKNVARAAGPIGRQIAADARQSFSAGLRALLK